MGTKAQEKKRKKSVVEGKPDDQVATLAEIKEFVAELREQNLEVDVRHFVRIDMIIDEPSTPKNTIGWVHTHGMWPVFGLPELEIRGVRPDFMMISAGQMLNHVAQYMVDSQTGRNGAKPVSAGQTFSMGHVTLRFEDAGPLNPEDADECAGHFTNPRLNLVNAVKHTCAACEAGTPHGPH